MEKGELKPLTQILKIIPVNMDGKMWIEQGFSRQTALETAETDTETAKIAEGTAKTAVGTAKSGAGIANILQIRFSNTAAPPPHHFSQHFGRLSESRSYLP